MIIFSSNIFLNEMYSRDTKLYFQHHYSSLQGHMIFRNHSNILISFSRNISYYYQCWKQLCCLIFIFLETDISEFCDEQKVDEKNNIYLKYIVKNIVFTVTFDQFNAFLQNKI